MFNTEISVHNQSNTQTTNNHTHEASFGQLVKMSKTSKIARFQKGSAMEKDFFCDEPFIRKKRRVKGEYNRLFGWMNLMKLKMNIV